MRNDRNVAIILAGGQGKRMNSAVPKQYLMLGNRPVLFYSMDIFEKSDKIDEMILVVGQGQIEYCKKEIVEKYNFKKVTHIVEGGKERFLSVKNGIDMIKNADNIFIHDGARPFVDYAMIDRVHKTLEKEEACIVGVPVKDTVKIADKSGYVNTTPARKQVWSIQTPQAFRFDVISEAYLELMKSGRDDVTDDAMVVECMLGKKVKLVEGSYKNIKITTPEDLQIGNCYVQEMRVFRGLE